MLLEEFQSAGTVHVVPEVRKMTVGEDCDAARCGSKKKDAMNIDVIISANAIGTWRTAGEARNMLISIARIPIDDRRRCEFNRLLHI